MVQRVQIKSLLNQRVHNYNTQERNVKIYLQEWLWSERSNVYVDNHFSQLLLVLFSQHYLKEHIA